MPHLDKDSLDAIGVSNPLQSLRMELTDDFL